MKKVLVLLFFLIFTATIVIGCGSNRIGQAENRVEAKYFIEEDGTEDYLDETNKDVVEVLDLIEAYEKVENEYDYKTADKTLRYPYVTDNFKEIKETGRWEQDIKEGKICMEWCDFNIDYIKFNKTLTEAEAEYFTCFKVLECGCMEESGFKDGATYLARIWIQVKKVDGQWKVDDYSFSSKNAERID
jgi:hypothetical protein